MISILDTTYREGKQSYLGHLLPSSMVDYAKLIEKVGIRYMEVGYPFVSDIYLREFRRLVSCGSQLRISVHSGFSIDNFKKLVEEGVTSIDTSLRFGMLTDRVASDKLIEIKETLDQCMMISRSALSFRFGIENAFKLPPEVLADFCGQVSGMTGVVRIGLSDTDGSADPETVMAFLTKLDKVLRKGIALELHLHNDCNLAGANFYAAYTLFKDSERELVIDATLGGIGERNGITSIGDVLSLLFLHDNAGLKGRYLTKHYAELYRYVFKDEIFNRDPLNPAMFTHSSGLHIVKFLEEKMYQSIDPATFGHDTTLVFNEFTSRDAIRAYAKIRLGLDMDDHSVSDCVSRVRNFSAEMKRSLDEKDLLSIVNDLHAHRK